ncbi:hypothetical protein VM95_20380 [Streptomyces rubellomurinus]|uniref:Uncharacterized protein n=1 Tax=Streptomyces rubellomurinus (strain ATCC 31215) TaxID=359131 RepID=A0A0F2TDF4_STRR3|nr:hypothetical protein VM95_20380 [Streptomyces rubellomurinus]
MPVARVPHPPATGRRLSTARSVRMRIGWPYRRPEWVAMVEPPLDRGQGTVRESRRPHPVIP